MKNQRNALAQAMMMQMMAQRRQMPMQQPPAMTGSPGNPMAAPQPGPVSGQEFWGAGGSGNPNMRVPSAAGLTGNNWSLANQGYFAPMGGPDFSGGVGDGGKPAAVPGRGGYPSPGMPMPAAVPSTLPGSLPPAQRPL